MITSKEFGWFQVPVHTIYKFSFRSFLKPRDANLDVDVAKAQKRYRTVLHFSDCRIMNHLMSLSMVLFKLD
jgi:hypothetical protein